MILNALKSGIVPLQTTEGTGNLDMLAFLAHVSDHKFLDPTSLKVLSLKQMFQKLP